MSSGPDAGEGPGTSGRQEANGNTQGQAGDATMADAGQAQMRVLALYCTHSSSSGAEQDQGFDPPDACNINLLAARPGVQVEVLRGPTLEAFSAKVESYRPTFVYISGPYSGLVDSIKGTVGPITLQDKAVSPGELLTALEGAPLDTVYLDAAGQEKVAELLRVKGLPNILFWSEDPSGLVAAHFSSVLFSMLALEPCVSLLEAYALSLYATQAHLGAKVDGKLTMPNMPDLLTGPADDPDSVQLALPDNSSVPPPQAPGVDLSRGLAAAVPGWMEVRLLAPRAELRLQVAGGSGMIDSSRLSYLGEALRALLVLEVRRAVLVSSGPPPAPPSHLYPGSQALACEVATASGCHIKVVLGGPPSVLQDAALVEHALRQTLVADALSLQFRLPPPGIPAPLPRVAQEVLGGCPVVDALLLTSVWAVSALRQLAQSPSYRGLVSLGVGAIGEAAVAGCSAADAARLGVIVTGMRGGVLLAEELVANGLPLDGISGSLVGSAPSSNPLAVPADPPIAPHNCGRAPIGEVSEEAFMSDLIAFLSHRRGRYIDRAKFPDAVLNGATLDLYGLYREVVTRGGFRVGNGLNWKGQIFGRMRNWTANNRQTGVGNSLKKHYANFLWEYEQAHPGDVMVDRCTLCGRGEEAGATDWIACDSCNSWVHFSCDRRPGLGTFEDYANAEQPRSYTCPNCARGAARLAQKAAAAVGGGSGGGGGSSGGAAPAVAAAAAAQPAEQQQQPPQAEQPQEVGQAQPQEAEQPPEQQQQPEPMES